MLREILRKMSKDDSQLQLKSLEQVLQLGHNIAQLDSQERLHEARLAHSHSLAAASHHSTLSNSGNNLSFHSYNQPGGGSGKKSSKSPSPRRGRPPASSAAFDAEGDDMYTCAQKAAYISPTSRFRAGNESSSRNDSYRQSSSASGNGFDGSLANSSNSAGGANGRAFLTVAQHQQDNGGSRGNVISRVAKVPGLTPDPSAKKIKKVSHLCVFSLLLLFICSLHVCFVFSNSGFWTRCKIVTTLNPCPPTALHAFFLFLILLPNSTKWF